VCVRLVLGVPPKSLLSRIKTSPIAFRVFMGVFIVELVMSMTLGVLSSVDILPHSLVLVLTLSSLLLGILLCIYCISLSLSGQLPAEYKNIMRIVLSVAGAVLLGCAGTGYYCSMLPASTGLGVHPSTPIGNTLRPHFRPD
jgi:hypothetical protein